jgi:hypothetical protein
MKPSHSFIDQRPFPSVIAVRAEALGGFTPLGGAPGSSSQVDPPAGPAGVWTRLEGWFRRARQSDDEAFLAAATDLADLERRVRRLERGVDARYY